jgi:hypothetical protein
MPSLLNKVTGLVKSPVHFKDGIYLSKSLGSFLADMGSPVSAIRQTGISLLKMGELLMINDIKLTEVMIGIWLAPFDIDRSVDWDENRSHFTSS